MDSTTRHERASVVLLVDDEETVLKFIRKVLEAAEYQVLTATNSVEAMQASARFPGVIDVLITDVRMRASQNGLELAKLLTALRPETCVLLTSGSPLPDGFDPWEKGWESLPKPFSPEALKVTVAALSGPRARRKDWISAPSA